MLEVFQNQPNRLAKLWEGIPDRQLHLWHPLLCSIPGRLRWSGKNQRQNQRRLPLRFFVLVIGANQIVKVDFIIQIIECFFIIVWQEIPEDVVWLMFLLHPLQLFLDFRPLWCDVVRPTIQSGSDLLAVYPHSSAWRMVQSLGPGSTRLTKTLRGNTLGNTYKNPKMINTPSRYVHGKNEN